MTSATGFQQQISEKLIRRAQSGDMLATKEIYVTYADACNTLALRICGNRALAQDIVHEVFIKVIEKIENYHHKGSFSGWLRRIVANETINRIKSENRLHLVGEEQSNELESNDLFNQDWLGACRDLDKLLTQLPMTTRSVLLLHELEGYTHQEIGNLYGKSESFSKVTLSRAYQSLRNSISQQEKINASKR